MTKYKIKGSKVGDLLGERLNEIGITGITGLEGVFVRTNRGTYYSEIYILGSEYPLSRSNFDENIKGLVETVTRNVAHECRDNFEVYRTL